MVKGNVKDGTIVLPFGKFKDRTIEECPSSYLRWLLDNCDWNDEVQEAAEIEYRWRSDWSKHWEE